MHVRTDPLGHSEIVGDFHSDEDEACRSSGDAEREASERMDRPRRVPEDPRKPDPFGDVEKRSPGKPNPFGHAKWPG